MKNNPVYHIGDGIIRDTVMLWPVWMEGYQVTGNQKTAEFLGNFFGTWKEAVTKAASKLGQAETYFNEEKLTYWGCRFFDNEEEARATFG